MGSFSFAHRLFLSAAVSILVSGVIGNFAFAQSEFDTKTPAFDEIQATIPMNEAEITKAIAVAMARDCKNGRCWLFGTEGKGTSWTAGVNAGVGSNNSYPSGTAVIIDNNQNYRGDTNEPYYGASVTYRQYQCESNLLVSPAMKSLHERYQYSAVNPDGSTKRTFSPAEQATFSMYITILQKLETCRQNGQQ